jgi:hypothetical protein
MEGTTVGVPAATVARQARCWAGGFSENLARRRRRAGRVRGHTMVTSARKRLHVLKPFASLNQARNGSTGVDRRACRPAEDTVWESRSPGRTRTLDSHGSRGRRPPRIARGGPLDTAHRDDEQRHDADGPLEPSNDPLAAVPATGFDAMSTPPTAYQAAPGPWRRTWHMFVTPPRWTTRSGLVTVRASTERRRAIGAGAATRSRSTPFLSCGRSS